MSNSNRLLAFTAMLTLSGCNSTPVPLGQAERLYDFDHQVHYIQTRYSDESFLINIDSDDYAHFQKQSTFLLRHAQTLCRNLDPVLTIKQGIQDIERLPQKIRPFQPNLVVWVRCEKAMPFPTLESIETPQNATP